MVFDESGDPADKSGKRRDVAVIGCGDMGTHHARAWAARADARVVAVFDPLPERRDRVAAEIGAQAYDSYEAAVLHEGVECVSVATPVAYHADVAVFAAANGRHVLSEKPIALTLPQAEAMIAAARQGGTLLAVSYQYRAFARNQKLRDLLRSGAFGGPIFARYADMREVRPKIAMHRQSMNGGPVIDMAGHYFDLMRFLTDTEPQTVFATGHVYGRGRPRLAEVDDFAIDAAAIEVGYGGGHTLTVFANWGMPEGFPGFGEEWFVGPALSVRNASGGGLAIQRTDGLETWQPESGDPGGPTARIADLMHALDTGEPLEVSGDDALIALRVSLAALESIATGRSVELGE